MAPTDDRRWMGTKPSPMGSDPGTTLWRAPEFFSDAWFTVPPDLFSSPEMPLFRSAASASCRQRQENAKTRKFAKTSRKRSQLRRRALSTEFQVINLIGAFLGISLVDVKTSLVEKQPLHLHLLHDSMDPGRSLILCTIGGRSVTSTHPTAAMRVEDAHASDDDGTLEGHDHDV